MNQHLNVFPFKCDSCEIKCHSLFVFRSLHSRNGNCRNAMTKREAKGLKYPTCALCPERDTPNHQKSAHWKGLPYECGVDSCQFRYDMLHLEVFFVVVLKFLSH